MQHSKVYQLLQLLTAAEWKALKNWVNSPWANSNKNLILLYDTLERGFPDFTGLAWEKETVYGKMYEQKPYNNKVFNNLLSEFSKLLQSFIAHQRLAHQPDIKEHFFITELMERRDTELFETTALSLIKTIESRTPKTEIDYSLLHQLYSQLYYQPNARFRYQADSEVLDKASAYFKIYSELKDLKHQHDLQIRAAMLKENGTKFKAFPTILPIQLFKIRLNRPEKLEISDYLHFKNLYYQHFTDLPKEYQQYFLFCCINDSVNLSGFKDIDAIAALFEHYQFGFQQDLLLQSGQMTAISFNNILLTASHLEELAFAQAFLQKYYLYLDKSLQQDAFHWGQAQVFYIAKKYDQSIAIIQAYNFTSEFFKMQSVGILLKVNFELFLADDSQFDALLSFCLAKEKYFQRSKIFSKPRRLAYIRFIQYLRRLINLVGNPTSTFEQIIAFEKDVEMASNFFGKGWLLNKIKLLFSVI